MNKLIYLISAALIVACTTSGNVKNGEDMSSSLVQDNVTQENRHEGFCLLEYTVTKLGTTKDISVVDCPNEIFLKPAIKAAKKFKYKPKIVDGIAVEVPGVKNRFIFQSADE